MYYVPYLSRSSNGNNCRCVNSCGMASTLGGDASFRFERDTKYRPPWHQNSWRPSVILDCLSYFFT